MSLLSDIAIATGLSHSDVLKIVATAPVRYRIYPIDKRRGDEKRIIAQPARELKFIQRLIVDGVLSALRVSPFATAYIRGKNIADNVRPHLQSRVILKLDFKDFFHSLSFNDLAAAMEQQEFKGVAPEDWKHLERILFWRHPAQSRGLCLSIGAPSSPFVSNVIMERLDQAIGSLCKQQRVAFTRYADDITFSGETVEGLLEVERQTIELVRAAKHPRLRFNDGKRGLFTKRNRRIVTGLTITPDQRISLGRQRKRLLSAAINRIANSTDRSQDHLSETQGWLAYALSVEPSFVDAMRSKYGDQVVARILRSRTPSSSGE